MSDLQCPATIVLVPAEAGAERVAGGLVFPMPDATGPALREAVDDLADLHRGHTVTVIAPAEAIRQALGRADPPAAPVVVTIDSSGWST